jgi:peptidoglycan hydrolase CwlO-like protein
VSGFDPTTPVPLTMRNILSAIWYFIIAAVTVIGTGALVVWAVVSFTIGGMRDDVKSIRESVQTLQVADKSNAASLQGLANRIERLDNSFADLSGKLDTTNAKLAAINASIEALSKRLDAVAQSGPGDERRKRR